MVCCLTWYELRSDPVCGFSVTGPSHGLPTQLNPVILNELSENEIAGNLFGSRKKARKAEDLVSQRQQPQHHHQLLTVPEFQLSNGPGSVVNPQSTGVSTGLRLTFDDDRLHSSSPPSSSGRGDAVKNYPTVMGEDLSSQLQQQREEIEQLLKLQVLILSAFSVSIELCCSLRFEKLPCNFELVAEGKGVHCCSIF